MQFSRHFCSLALLCAAAAALSPLAIALPASGQCHFDTLLPTVPDDEAHMGESGAISGDYAILGAPWDDVNGFQNTGSVDIFRKVPGGWIPAMRLTAPQPAAFSLFGRAVDIDDDIVIIGEPSRDIAGYDNVGQACLYYRNANNQWVYGTTFTPAAGPSTELAHFGSAVSLDGSYLLIGMPDGPSNVFPNSFPGVVHVYKQTFGVTGWTLQDSIFSPVDDDEFQFGSVIAVQHGTSDENTVAMIGAPAHDLSSLVQDSGRVYLHQKPAAGSSWASSISITPSEFQIGGRFGAAVAIDGDTLVAGAPGMGTATHDDVGAVYVFKRQPGSSNWSQVAKIVCPDDQEGAEFGTNVAIEGEWIVASSKWRSYMIHNTNGNDWSHEWTLKGVIEQMGSSAVGAVGISDESILHTNPDYGTQSMFGFGAAGIYRFNDGQGANTCAYAEEIAGTWASGCMHPATRDGAAWCEFFDQGPDVWYAWTAPCHGTVTFDTEYSDFDTILSVHSACPNGAQTNVLACNDDVSDTDDTSSLSIDVEAGGTYIIRIGAPSSIDVGWYILNVDFECGPACIGDIVSSSTFQPPPDGQIDGADLAYLLGAWGPNNGSPADLVDSATFQPPPDGVVDAADLAALLGAWGACN